MKHPEWPGIATVVGILLILALIVIGSRDDFHLKEWQTVIAACIALFGGTLAYQGAMAKIYEDRNRERRELDRKKQGLFLRLRFGLDRLSNHAAAKEFRLTPRLERDGSLPVNPLVPVKQLQFEKFEELEEAWSNLDIMPQGIALQIDRLRRELKRIDEMLKDLPDNARTMDFVIPGEQSGGYLTACAELRSSAVVAVAALDNEISKLSS